MSTIMNFENFKNKLMEDLACKFSSEDCPVKLRICTIPGNNGVCEDEIKVSIDGRSTSPCVPLSQYYADYKESEDYERIVNEVETFINNIADMSETLLVDEENLKVFFKLVNAKLNDDLLSHIPHRIIDGLDLAITYHVLINDSGKSVTSYAIKNGDLECGEEKLYEMALKNTPAIFDTLFKSMAEHLGINIKDGADTLYVLSNKYDINGAAVVAYPGCLEKVSEEMERRHGSGDFYVLPCSIHEVLVISATTEVPISYMVDMIREANTTAVLKKDILSYNLYRYQKNTGKLEIVEPSMAGILKEN